MMDQTLRVNRKLKQFINNMKSDPDVPSRDAGSSSDGKRKAIKKKKMMKVKTMKAMRES